MANEIRRLADTTNEQSIRISISIKEMADKITISGENSKQTEKSINEIYTNLDSIKDIFSELLQGLQEISQGSMQITSSLSELIDSSASVKISTSEVDIYSNELLNEIVGYRIFPTRTLRE